MKLRLQSRHDVVKTNEGKFNSCCTLRRADSKFRCFHAICWLHLQGLAVEEETRGCVDSLTLRQTIGISPQVCRTRHLHADPCGHLTVVLGVKRSSTQSAIWHYGCQCGSEFPAPAALSPVRIRTTYWDSRRSHLV